MNTLRKAVIINASSRHVARLNMLAALKFPALIFLWAVTLFALFYWAMVIA